VPDIVILPAPVAVVMVDDSRKTPKEFVPVPHEVPVMVSEPALVATVVPLRVQIPTALSNCPRAAVPVIVTLPVPVAEMLEDELRITP
jgi:hypothetical protein